MLPQVPARPALGPLGERLAAEAYERAGARVLARNLRNPLGEIDLLVEDGATLVAVEVKTRTADADGGFAHGRPAEAVDGARLRRLAHALDGAARALGEPGAARRIDVVEVAVGRDGALLDLRILRDVTR